MRRVLFVLPTALLLACPSNSQPTPPAPTTATDPRAALPPLAGARGMVEGRVTLDGPAPKFAPLKTSESVAAACGDTVEDPAVRVGEKGGVAGVVVALELAKDGKSGPHPEVTVDQKGCLYSPTTVAARAGATVIFVNSDPVLHNVRGATDGRSVFNVAMPLEGMKVKKTLPASAGTLELKCDVHPWMHAAVRTFEHDHFTITDAKGQFKLDSAPAGKHRITFWHPRLGELTQEIEVPKEGVASVDLAVPVSALAPPGTDAK